MLHTHNRSSFRIVLPSDFNFISAPPDRLYIFRFLKRISHLLAQMPDMGSDRIAFFVKILIPPDLMEQLLRADYLSSLLTQDTED